MSRNTEGQKEGHKVDHIIIVVFQVASRFTNCSECWLSQCYSTNVVSNTVKLVFCEGSDHGVYTELSSKNNCGIVLLLTLIN